MFPRDAVSISLSTKTAGTYTLVPATTTPITILDGMLNNNSSADQSVILGSMNIVQGNNGLIRFPAQIVYTNLPLTVIKTGAGTTTYGVTLVYRDRHNTYDPPVTDPALNTSSTTLNFSSTTPLYNGMNLQESLFVYCVIIALLSFGVWRLIFGKPTTEI
jgi:hypothetical protein